ncbi:MAG: MBL fold metallo-hydrolase [Candidatus Latescibacteria bacterium]|nr:MBL fold metallo-hydrolase [Candidatus Latescibacterota bacterium]
MIKLTFLGTGTSHGVPMIACECRVCTSPNPRNHRTRTSAFLEYNGGCVLIDTPQEHRIQAIRNRIQRVDALLLTHTHADHIHGLDDVRRYSQLHKKPVPCYGTPTTLDTVRRVFEYAFTETPRGGGKPQIDLHPIDEDRAFPLFDIDVLPVPVWHGETPVLGFRFNGLAYVTDTNQIPPSSFERLKDLDVLVLDALRPRPHITHYSLYQALDVVDRLRPKRAYFVHMTHDLDHEETNAWLGTLMEGVELAYDGLTITV